MTTGYIPPPPVYAEQWHHAPDGNQVYTFPALNEDEIREALAQFVGEHCCYGAKPARDMKFLGMDSSDAIKYKLETFCEKRETLWVAKSYTGPQVHSFGSAPPPGPWDMDVPTPAYFKAAKTEIEMPGTSAVKPCHDCSGVGRRMCSNCQGNGHEACRNCHNHGHFRNTDPDDMCTFCRGTGNARCTICLGSGYKPCKTCGSNGQIKSYLQLTVNWTPLTDNFFINYNELPQNLLENVTGDIAFIEELPKVWPLNHFPKPAVNVASAQLVQKHDMSCSTGRIIIQRHQVLIIPITKVFYMWKNKRDSFFVYGKEKLVYAPSYPQQCCCGTCSVL